MLLAYLYIFPRWLDWNQNSRFDLTAAIVERGELSIDAYVANTGDYAESTGALTAIRHPGYRSWPSLCTRSPTKLTEIPAVQTIITTLGRSPAAASTVNRPIDQVPDQEFVFTANMALATLVTVALPSALLGVLIYMLLGRMGYSRRVRALAVLVYGVATPAFAYSAAFYGHQPAAIMLFAAFAWMYTLRRHAPGKIESFALGALLGLHDCHRTANRPARRAARVVCDLGDTPSRSPSCLMIVGGFLPIGHHGRSITTPSSALPSPLAYQHRVNPVWKARFGTGVLSANVLSTRSSYGD